MKHERSAGKGLQDISHFFLSGSAPPGANRPAVLKSVEPVAEPGPKRRRVVSFLSLCPQVPSALFTCNIGLDLAAQGKNVFIVDVEKRQPNVESTFGMRPATLGLSDILYPSENKIFRDVDRHLRVLDFRLELSALPSHERERDRRLVELLDREESDSEWTLVNLPRSSRLLQNPEWVARVNEVVLLTGPETQGMIETYASIKSLFSIRPDLQIYVGICEAASYQEAREVFEKISSGTLTLLRKKINSLGFLLKDPSIVQSLQEQVPVMKGANDSVQKGIRMMTRVLMERNVGPSRFFAAVKKK